MGFKMWSLECPQWPGLSGRVDRTAIIKMKLKILP